MLPYVVCAVERAAVAVAVAVVCSVDDDDDDLSPPDAPTATTSNKHHCQDFVIVGSPHFNSGLVVGVI